MPKAQRGSVSSNLLLCPRPSVGRAYTFVTTDLLVPVQSMITRQERAAVHQLWLHQGTRKMGSETLTDTSVKLRVGAAVSQRIFY